MKGQEWGKFEEIAKGVKGQVLALILEPVARKALIKIGNDICEGQGEGKGTMAIPTLLGKGGGAGTMTAAERNGMEGRATLTGKPREAFG